jgi:hypothetical protein
MYQGKGKTKTHTMELTSLMPLAAIWVPLFECHLRPKVFLIRLSLEPKYLVAYAEMLEML